MSFWGLSVILTQSLSHAWLTNPTPPSSAVSWKEKINNVAGSIENIVLPSAIHLCCPIFYFHLLKITSVALQLLIIVAVSDDWINLTYIYIAKSVSSLLVALLPRCLPVLLCSQWVSRLDVEPLSNGKFLLISISLHTELQIRLYRVSRGRWWICFARDLYSAVLVICCVFKCPNTSQ